MKNSKIKFLIAAFAVVFGFGANASAQSDWLDMSPLPGWNERSRAILQTKKVSAAELRRCAVVVRQPTLVPDRMVTRMGWTLTGAAHIFGNTTVVSVAEAFDGQCRPLRFQSLVFVGDRIAGTLAPGQMDSRTDGYLTNVRLTGARNLTAEYARYRTTDALCCPYKIEAVTFVVKPDADGNFLLVPESKTTSGLIENQASSGGENNGGAKLENTVWRWQSAGSLTGKLQVDKPENYTLEFDSDGKLRVKADCNGGGARYETKDGGFSIKNVFTTKMFCGEKSLDNVFLKGLQSAKNFQIEGDTLTLEGAGDYGTMYFVRAARQN